MAEEGPMAQISLAGSAGALKGLGGRVGGSGRKRGKGGERWGGEVRSTRTEAN